MSIFNFRRGRPASDNAPGRRSAASPATESVELVRKRARQRLIGSAVLVLLGVVGFPLLFETQPRPVPVDIPIEIPSRTSVKPASPVLPVERAAQAPFPADPVTTPAAQVPVAEAPPATAAAPAVPPHASLQDKEEIVPPQEARAPARIEAKTDSKPETKAEAKAEVKPEPKLDAKPKADDGQRAKALLEGSAVKSAASESRIVVQVGAFADAAKARDARAKLEKAGLKTYTQMADTKDGMRIRVRVGPYASKAEAEKAAAKVKSLNLPAAILVL